MKPVVQTITGRGPKFNEICGNCLQAALASVLEVPLDSVPHFCDLPEGEDPDSSEWANRMNAWMQERFNMMVAYIPATGDWRPTGYHLMSGISPRGSMHETVGFNGQLVHDPHPAGGGVTVQYWGLFICTNPADPR